MNPEHAPPTNVPGPPRPAASDPPHPAGVPDPRHPHVSPPPPPLSVIPGGAARDPAFGEGAARRAFLAAALRRPAQVGAVVPSSSRLAGLLASVVPSQGAPVVVELGPGTGAVSTVIARRLPAGSRHIAVELDPRMAEFLRRREPRLEVVDGDASALVSLLAERQVERVDAVVSGLPWSLFGHRTQRAILDQVRAAIAPDGAFATFAYRHTMPLATARRFRDTLHEVFDEVVVSRTVWRNLPPAFCYVCRRPR